MRGRWRRRAALSRHRDKESSAVFEAAAGETVLSRFDRQDLCGFANVAQTGRLLDEGSRSAQSFGFLMPLRRSGTLDNDKALSWDFSLGLCRLNSEVVFSRLSDVCWLVVKQVVSRMFDLGSIKVEET